MDTDHKPKSLNQMIPKDGLHVRWITSNKGKISHYGVFPNSEYNKSGTPIEIFNTREEAEAYAASHISGENI